MKPVLFIVFHLLLLHHVQAQADSVPAGKIIYQACQSPGLSNPALVLKVYECLQFRKVWTQPALLQELDSLFGQAAQYGFNGRPFFKAFREIENTRTENETDSIKTDLKRTDLLIAFIRDIVSGDQVPQVGYSGISCMEQGQHLPGLICTAIRTGHLFPLIESIEINTTSYLALKKEIMELLRRGNARQEDTLRLLFQGINSAKLISCLLQYNNKVVLVNIPSATLELYCPDSLLLFSRVIVGKPATRTPALTSQITDIILYPYWMVPHKIASRELLPLIKKNPGYINQNNFQVLDGAGRLTDPATINWKALTASSFPYTLRQSTGCDNSLGLIKFNFQSPYSVYLHDTPWKLLFGLPQRFFSHGCIRVEKSRELARLLLGENAAAMDTLITENPPAVHNSVFIRLSAPVPVLIVYNTAWPDSTGKVNYYRDIYHKEER